MAIDCKLLGEILETAVDMVRVSVWYFYQHFVMSYLKALAKLSHFPDSFYSIIVIHTQL